jgi:hypothetical protein
MHQNDRQAAYRKEKIQTMEAKRQRAKKKNEKLRIMCSTISVMQQYAKSVFKLAIGASQSSPNFAK